MTTDSEYSTDPSVRTDPTISGRSGRYPNQFFDLSQQYMPPTIKELFRWCTFYYYNSPLIGSTISKISRYPITDLIIEDEHESVRNIWNNVFNKELKIKNVLMEINLDHFVYGNAFISMHLPFTRNLICTKCKKRYNINMASWKFRLASNSGHFILNCSCGHSAPAEVKDVPYRDRSGIRIIRWNPENINIKYNDYTGRYVYMYSVPRKLRAAINRGDKDLVEDLPMIVIDAVAQNKMIRFNNDNFRHIKRPTLAEQDQGWGKPVILHVLKDMFYFYTLRRAQEAIAMEHIVPFDIIYPMPNAQQDPYINTDLASWRTEIQSIIRRHRRDPNYKGVIPIPVGFGRLGGDGKAMMLTPELGYLNQTIVAGMGFNSDMLLGSMNWTGSSVTLRMLENDFIQNRTQLLDTVNWIKDKVKVWCDLPSPKSLRFADFRMADDIQRNQQLIGLNAQKKVSDQTMLTELGYDWEQEKKKIIEEAYLAAYIEEIMAKNSAKSQGEATIVQNKYQQRIQEIAQKAQESAQKKMTQNNPNDFIDNWANRLTQMDPQSAQNALMELKTKAPQVANAVELKYNQSQSQMSAEAPGAPAETNMAPKPEKNIPRRTGEI